MDTANDDNVLADLRAKLAQPDPRDGVSRIVISWRAPLGFKTWSSRRDADAALRDLRKRGFNVDKGIRIQRVETWVRPRPYVVTRLGDFGETMLMTESGAWVPGMLLAEQPGDGGSIWMPYDGAALEPATFSHVTSTGPWVAARTERYKTKSNGSCGRWVWSDDSVAYCTCDWKAYRETRAEAQAAARVHRSEVAA
jgi:hypothetical protein